MSIVFSDTTNKSGIIQQIEKKLGFVDGDISGDATKLAQFTADVNTTHDRALATIFQVGGTWQFDDSNQTDYPIITTDLVSGQRDYPFSVDANSNLILDVYKVFVKDPSGIFSEIYPVDVQEIGATDSFTDGINIGGTPNQYDKFANGLFLNPLPNYNSTGGLKMYVNREGSYFTVSDTTKKPGIAGLFHEYYVYRPCWQYATNKSLPSAAGFEREMLRLEDAIKDYYKAREKDVKKHMTPVFRSSR